MAYSWDNRVKFVVRYMYDIDNNGFLDKNDFECLAVRNTVIEGKGDWNEATFKKNQEVMANLWNEIAELADFNKVLASLLHTPYLFTKEISSGAFMNYFPHWDYALQGVPTRKHF